MSGFPGTTAPNLREKMKKLRFIAALFVAFGSLLFATPAQADDPADPVVVVVTTPGGDDSSYQIPLTTTVTFDGVQYSSVYATTNSVITFGQPDGTYWTYPSTPSISLYSMDWLVYPNIHNDEHLIISASDGGFQVDISARPIWLYSATEPTNINIVAAINTDGTVAISYSLTGPSYEGQTRTGVRLTNGSIVTLEEYGIVHVDTPPVLEPEPVTPTPTPTPTVEPTPTPEPTSEPVVRPPFVPEGATLISEGSSVEVIAPEGQRIVSITAWYGDPADGSRGVDVSSTLTQLATGQTSVTIDSNNMYGDPAPGTVKTLIFVVNYETIPVVPPVPPIEPTPSPTQTIEPTPQPTTTEEPIAPTPAPVDPDPTPTEEPAPAPAPSEEPVVQPTEDVVEPSPAPEPPAAPEAVVEELVQIAPEDLTDAQVEQLVAAAEETLATAEQGSPEYEAALEALAVAAEADDPEVPAELAAIPLLGNAAAAVLDSLNALGNVGADMAPAVREEAKKTVIASVIAAGAAVSAVQAAASAASAAASVASSGSTGGNSGGGASGSSEAKPISRRKID